MPCEISLIFVPCNNTKQEKGLSCKHFEHYTPPKLSLYKLYNGGAVNQRCQDWQLTVWAAWQVYTMSCLTSVDSVKSWFSLIHELRLLYLNEFSSSGVYDENKANSIYISFMKIMLIVYLCWVKTATFKRLHKNSPLSDVLHMWKQQPVLAQRNAPPTH